MRAAMFTALAMAALALAACGGQGSSSQQAASPPLTDAQMKTLVATLPAPYNTGDPARGKAVFTQCAACHTTVQGGPNMTGPNLWGIFGHPVAHQATFAYSDALKAQSFTWDAARIDTWITNPRGMIPGTKMSFIGLPNAQDRIDVIAYLKGATSPAP